MSDMESQQRGRPIVSTGRGGAGNLVRSVSRGVDPEAAAPGVERGRELTPREMSGDRVTHAGRGGAGNIRSPSREPRDRVAEAKEDALQNKLVAQARGRQADQAFSTGRGGSGNISRSKSRSRSAVRGGNQAHEQHDMHASGRGGYGNISEERASIDEEKLAAEKKYEAEVLAKHRAAEAHQPTSTGRGGANNIHDSSKLSNVDMSKLTLEERDAYLKVHEHDGEHGVSTGKGGAGNIHPPHQAKEHSPADGERGRDKGGLLGSVMRSLSRAAGKDKDKPST